MHGSLRTHAWTFKTSNMSSRSALDTWWKPEESTCFHFPLSNWCYCLFGASGFWNQTIEQQSSSNLKAVCSLFFLSLNFKSGILHVLSTLSLSSDLHQGPISPTYSTHRSSQTKEGVVPEIYCWLGIGYWVLGIGYWVMYQRRPTH